jgi:tetratricopeptide (TPR) repeat protein
MRRGLQELQKALRMYQGLGHSEGTAYTCCALGGLFRMLGRYSQSEKFYREANRRMRLRKDVFGIAYSYCGLGNVERMSGRFLQALPFYRKAEKLYATIGDRVSYAYTLWSIATTYKMLGQYSPSWSAYQEADHLFRITGDTRGLIYSRLGFAEIEYLKGDQAKGNKHWQQALDLSSKSDFAWEKLHVAALKKGGKQNLYTSYRKAGSLFYPRQLPINWP